MHRTAAINEYSTRYSEAIDSAQMTPPDQWRAQATSNRQGSSGFIMEWPEGWRTEANDDADPSVGAPATCDLIYERPGFRRTYSSVGPEDMTIGDYLSQQEESLKAHSDVVYRERLELGVAREQARKDLPLSTYTLAFWKIDLHNLLHFLALRMDSHAQQEIRTYATIIGEQIVKPLFPLVWEAFVDFRLEAMSLSRLEIEAIRSFMNSPPGYPIGIEGDVSQREIATAMDKFRRLGLIQNS